MGGLCRGHQKAGMEGRTRTSLEIIITRSELESNNTHPTGPVYPGPHTNRFLILSNVDSNVLVAFVFGSHITSWIDEVPCLHRTFHLESLSLRL
jgi:hypothetical protein